MNTATKNVKMNVMENVVKKVKIVVEDHAVQKAVVERMKTFVQMIQNVVTKMQNVVAMKIVGMVKAV